MTLSLVSQRITTPKSISSSLILTPNSQKKNPNCTNIKAESKNGGHLQRASIKTPQQNQPINKRIIQSAPVDQNTNQDSIFFPYSVMGQIPNSKNSSTDDGHNGKTNGGATIWRSQGESTSSYSRGRTPLEIKEGEGEYKMRFDMPGMTKEDVKVWVEEKMMVLKAEKVKKDGNGESDEEAVDDGEWRSESYGKYSFRVILPENVQFEKIKAEVKDGVLYVIIPKAPVSSKILDINVQ